MCNLSSPTCLNCSSKLQLPWLLPPPAPPTGLLLCEFGVGGWDGGRGRGGNGPNEDGGKFGGIRGPEGEPFPNCFKFANNACGEFKKSLVCLLKASKAGSGGNPARIARGSFSMSLGSDASLILSSSFNKSLRS